MNALINLSTNRFADLRRHNLAGLGALPSMVTNPLAQGSPIIDEVVQNLHDLAKASAEANQQQQQRANDALKYENDEPLDCGIRNSAALEDMARSFMASKAAENDNMGNDLTKENEWKCKNEGDDAPR